MKEKIIVLIADDNTEFGDLLKNYMARFDDIKVAGVARDGFQTIDMIKTLKPDVVILDIIMPNLDGIGVLEKVPKIGLERKPLFIMLSAIGQDVFVQKAISLGAEYYIVKPFSVDILVSRIRQIFKERPSSPFSDGKMVRKVLSKNTGYSSQETNIEAGVTNVMRSIGIPPHMSGYQYIREAVLQAINDTDIFSSVTKVLYPAVAKKFKTTPLRVERAIRNAIESAWHRGTPGYIETLSGYKLKNKKNKPTNSEFIALMVNEVKNEMGLDE